MAHGSPVARQALVMEVVDPSRAAQPKQTIPTGLAGVPPSGPATPVIATA
jgi:hypothetical protein